MGKHWQGTKPSFRWQAWAFTGFKVSDLLLHIHHAVIPSQAHSRSAESRRLSTNYMSLALSTRCLPLPEQRPTRPKCRIAGSIFRLYSSLPSLLKRHKPAWQAQQLPTWKTTTAALTNDSGLLDASYCNCTTEANAAWTITSPHK